MKYFKKLFQSIIIFISLISLSNSSFVNYDPSNLLSCDELYSVIFADVSKITEYIDENIYYLKQKYPECIDLLVNNGRLEALDYYLDELDKRRIEYRKDLAKSIRHIKEELEDVNIKYRFQKITYKNIFPASQWAQSLDNIFIEIKFAHRHDSPGCLEVEDKKIDLKEDSLSFTGTCSLGDDHIRIEYNVNFAKKINVALSTNELGAVGRYRFTLKKAERGFWEKLLKDGEEMHSNMRIWYEMKEKYQDELMGYEKDEDEENDKDNKEKENDKDDDNNKEENKDNNKKDEKKVEEPKKEEKKKEESKKEEPKKDEKKKEEVKKEEPKKEEKKKEEPKKEEKKKEEIKKEEIKKEEVKKEEPKKEEKKKEEPKKEEKKKEEPKKEEIKKKEPKKEEKKKEETKKEEPKKEEKKKEEPKKEEKKKEEPKKEEKKKEELKKNEQKIKDNKS